MSTKNKFSRLRLRSQTQNDKTRNNTNSVISHYFKKPSSSDTDDVSPCCETTEPSPENDIAPKRRLPASKPLKSLNLSDDFSDFSTPKPVKRVIPKIFEPKFKPKPESSKRGRKKLVVNKKITESSRKFLYESTDYNQEHLHLAMALSKSIQVLQNPDSEPSCSKNDDELTPTQEQIIKIKENFSKFKSDAPPFIKPERIPSKPVKTKKTRNNPFMSILVRRTVEDRNQIIQRKFTEILLETSTDVQNGFYDHSERLIEGDLLKCFYCREKILFNKAALCGGDENFYTNLVSPTTAKCGNLLRDWSKILGREVTPPREVVLENKDASICRETLLELNLEIPNILSTQNAQKLVIPEKSDTSSSPEENLNNISTLREVDLENIDVSICKEPLLELNVEISNILCTQNAEKLVTPEKSDTISSPDENLNITPPLEVVLENKDASNSREPPLLALNVEIPNILCTQNAEKLVIPEKSSLVSTNNITIRSITPELFSDDEDGIFFRQSPKNGLINQTFTVDSEISPPDEVFDLTQSSDDNLEELPQLSEDVADNSDKSNDSLADFPQFNIKYTLTRPQPKIIVASNDQVIDLSQSSDSCDKNQRAPGEHNSKITSLPVNSFENILKESESSLSETPSRNLTKLSRKSRSFLDETPPRNTSLKKFSSFLDNFEISSHLDRSFSTNKSENYRENKTIASESSSSDCQTPARRLNKSFLEDNPPGNHLNRSTSPNKSLRRSLPEENTNGTTESSSSECQRPAGRSRRNLTRLSRKSRSFLDETPPQNTSAYIDDEVETFSHRNRHSSSNNSGLYKENKNGATEASSSECQTPADRLNQSRCNLSRKSRSFLDNMETPPRNNSLKKFSSFLDNFDYELETSTHISLNANKPNRSKSPLNVRTNNGQSDSQTTDDDLIVISDEELNYSCSTPYRKIERSSTTSSHDSGNQETISKEFTSHQYESPIIKLDKSRRKSAKGVNEEDKPQDNFQELSFQNEMYDHYDMNLYYNCEPKPVETTPKPELPTNISALLGDSFDKDLRRPLWDRIAGKKQPKTPVVVHNQAAIHFETPTTEVVIKTHDVTPMPDYDAMPTPEISKELQKFGLKSLKRRRATQLLKYLYEQTHPLDETNREVYSDVEEDQPVVKRKKRVSLRLSTVDNFSPVPLTKIDIVGDLIVQSCPENELIFETKQSTKIPSCRLPFHIAWHNYVSENPELRLKILTYFPIQLEEICGHFKEMGFKYHVNDIVSFLDKKCITIRTNQNNQRNKKSGSKKRY